MLINDDWKVEVEALDYVLYSKAKEVNNKKSERMKANWASGKLGKNKVAAEDDDGEKELMGEGKNKGWKRIGYYSNLHNILNALINHDLQKSGMIDFMAVIDRLDKLDRDIIAAINSNH
jgi:hypothetical protein